MTTSVHSIIAWLTPVVIIWVSIGLILHLLLTPFLERDEVKKKTGIAWFWFAWNPMTPAFLYRKSVGSLWLARDWCLKSGAVAAGILGIFRLTARYFI